MIHSIQKPKYRGWVLLFVPTEKKRNWLQDLFFKHTPAWLPVPVWAYQGQHWKGLKGNKVLYAFSKEDLMAKVREVKG